ncbi:arsenosugar biosynthesis radical SAM (seleno)protein ArsS [Pseudomonadota bacterium]
MHANLKAINPSTDYVTTSDFKNSLQDHGIKTLTRAPLQELQINLGRLCNQACEHCHVDAGPNRKEIMTWEIMGNIVGWAKNHNIKKVDITGGAPELNPHFREFVDTLLELDISITSRCNLTVLFESGQEDLARWYAQRHIRLVCSLPCYTQENVDSQRGRGVFLKSINALRQLNELGYGRENDLPLDLVYNPGGPFLPPPQQILETDYRANLENDFGVDFSKLLTLTNLPINRFAHYLERTGKLAEYQQLLVDSFNPGTIPGLMCRHLISIDWLGKVYDCDFNQMLSLPLENENAPYLWDMTAATFENEKIAIGPHCYGCTAGAGSSCGGALV